MPVRWEVVTILQSCSGFRKAAVLLRTCNGMLGSRAALLSRSFVVGLWMWNLLSEVYRRVRGKYVV